MFDKLFSSIQEEEKSVKTGLNQTSIRRYVNKSFLRSQIPETRKATGPLRASGMYFLCPRQAVYSYFIPCQEETHDLKSSLLMDAGTWIHWYLQNKVLGPAQILKGQWQGNPDKYEGYQYNCKDEYIERQINHPEYHVRGHVDGFVDLQRFSELCKVEDAGLSGEALLEIKTTANQKYSYLHSENDIPDWYKMQTEIYLHLTGLDKTLFMYMDRDNFDYKFIVYNYTDIFWKQAEEKILIIQEGVKTKTLPKTKCIRHNTCKCCTEFLETLFQKELAKQEKENT